MSPTTENQAGRGRFLGAVLAVASFLASGCTSSNAGNGPVDASSGADATSCRIVLASDYDQSCVADTDCVAVGQIPSCPAAPCDGCQEWTVSKNALAQYVTAAAPTSVTGADCGCPSYNPLPCCRGGTCTTMCSSSTDTLHACSDAGGSCSYPAQAGCSSGKAGPPDACAYSDEVCCL